MIKLFSFLVIFAIFQFGVASIITKDSVLMEENKNVAVTQEGNFTKKGTNGEISIFKKDEKYDICITIRLWDDFEQVCNILVLSYIDSTTNKLEQVTYEPYCTDYGPFKSGYFEHAQTNDFSPQPIMSGNYNYTLTYYFGRTNSADISAYNEGVWDTTYEFEGYENSQSHSIANENGQTLFGILPGHLRA